MESDRYADPAVRRALSDFYREEFLKHLDQLQSQGFVHDGNRHIVHRARAKLLTDIERVCCRKEFSSVAETLLQSFDALTRLSEREARPRH